MIQTQNTDPALSFELSLRDAVIVDEVMALHDDGNDPSDVSNQVHDWVHAAPHESDHLHLSGEAAVYACSLLEAATEGALITRSNTAVTLRRRQQRSARRVVQDLMELPETADTDFEPSALDKLIVDGLGKASRLLREHHGATHARKVLGRITTSPVA